MTRLYDVLQATRDELLAATNGAVADSNVTLLDRELPTQTGDLPSVVYEVFTTERPIGGASQNRGTVYDTNGVATDVLGKEYMTAQFDIRVLADDVNNELTVYEAIRQRFLPYNSGVRPTDSHYSDDVHTVHLSGSTPSANGAIDGRTAELTVHFERTSAEPVTPIETIEVDRGDDGSVEYTITEQA